MRSCLTCKHRVYDKGRDEYCCRARRTKIHILLNPSECRSYEKSEDDKWSVQNVTVSSE